MKIKSKCWVVDHWVVFTLTINAYENIMTFLNAQNLLFLSNIELDFSTIPLELHGNGESKTLVQYLANNTDNNALISKFLDYFLNVQFNMKYYYTGEQITFYFPEESGWQNFQIYFNPPATTTTTSTTFNPIINGESVMFYFQENNIYKYVINDFTTETLTNTMSFDLDSNIWYIDQRFSVENKGFITIFYDDDNTYRIFINRLDGTIIYQKDVTYYNQNFVGKYSTIQYEENGKNYFVVYNGNSVNTFEFDNYMYINTNYDDYLDGGIIVYEENVNKYYLILDDSTSKILLYQNSGNTYSSCTIYEFSDLISFFTYEQNTNYILSLEIYNTSGNKVLNFSFTGISSALLGIDYLSYISNSGDFSFSLYDVTLRYIFYYSSTSNTISYNTISIGYDYSMEYSGVIRYDNYNNYYSQSQLFIFYKGYINQTNNIYYYDSVFMLPVFKDDLVIRDLYEFTTGATSGWTYYVRLSIDYINMMIDSGGSNYDILVFPKSGNTSINTTNILIGDSVNNNYYLYDRNILLIYNNGEVGNQLTTHFISLNGIESSGFTFSGNINYNINLSRNTFIFTQSGITTYYTNSQTGNVFNYINIYYDRYENSNYYEPLSNGNILVYSSELEIGQMITDDSISDSFSIIIIENADISKYSVNVGRNYFSILQVKNQSRGIPYTHTQLLSSYGPVDPLNYIMDGQVLSGDTYFGSGSSYFTNMYPGLFVMIADQISIKQFKIVGDLGADGGGNSDSYQYSITGGTYSTDYTVFVKMVYGAVDPSINHIIIVNNNGNGISHQISSDTNNDLDSISGLTNTTRIDYLLLSRTGGTMFTRNELSGIVTQYLNIVDNNNISVSLSLLNSGYTNIMSGITDVYYFTDYGNGDNTIIYDGGSDMYDSGNIILPLIIPEDSVLTRLSYFNLNGGIIDTISYDNYDLSNDNYFGDRYFGYLNINNFIFDGSNIILISNSNSDDGFNINNWIWWND